MRCAVPQQVKNILELVEVSQLSHLVKPIESVDNLCALPLIIVVNVNLEELLGYVRMSAWVWYDLNLKKISFLVIFRRVQLVTLALPTATVALLVPMDVHHLDLVSMVFAPMVTLVKPETYVASHKPFTIRSR